MILYITEMGSVLRSDGGRFVVTKGEERLAEIPKEKLEGVVLLNGTSATNQCIYSLMEKGISVSYINSTGDCFGKTESIDKYNIEMEMKQFEAYKDVNFCFEMAKKTVYSKLQNCSVVLGRLNKRIKNNKATEIIKRLKGYRNTVAYVKNIDKLRGLEGIAAKEYFDGLKLFVKEEFYFDKRSRMPARDRFNCVINFCYTLLYNEIYNCIALRGLNPYIGYYHKIKKGHCSLASDVMESWRCYVVDSFVVKLINDDFFCMEDFYGNCDEGFFLCNSSKKKIISKFEEVMRATNKYWNMNEESVRSEIYEQIGSYMSALKKLDENEYNVFTIR